MIHAGFIGLYRPETETLQNLTFIARCWNCCFYCRSFWLFFIFLFTVGCKLRLARLTEEPPRTITTAFSVSFDGMRIAFRHRVVTWQNKQRTNVWNKSRRIFQCECDPSLFISVLWLKFEKIKKGKELLISPTFARFIVNHRISGVKSENKTRKKLI